MPETSASTKPGSHLRLSDGTVWPLPPVEAPDGTSPNMLGRAAEVEWRLRYAPDQITEADRMLAASILHAYGWMTTRTNREQRDLVCREIRAELATRAATPETDPAKDLR